MTIEEKNMNRDRECQCEKLYQNVVSGESDSSNYVYFDLAQCFIEGFDPQKLRDLLTSGDASLVSDGIFLLDEVGGLARDFAPEIRALCEHADPHIRRVAVKLADVYLSTPQAPA